MENGVYYLLRDRIGIPRYMYRLFVENRVNGLVFLFTIQYYLKLEIGATIQWGVLRLFVFAQLLV